MSYLRLSNETTNSCDYKVYLSNPFNQEYYRQIRITSTNYGKSASSIRDYVVYKDAPDSGTSCYVRGVVDDGMSAGRTYTLYAYAQAANGTWYLAGEDTITTLDSSDEKYDYGFKSVEVTTEEPYKIGDEIRIVAEVKNYKSSAGPDYKVEVRDKNGTLLDKDNENALDGKDSDKANLYPVIEQDQVKNGYIEYTVSIKADESGWTEVDDSDNEKTIEIPVIVDGNDDFSSATTLSFGYRITGCTIDQENDQDYYLIDDIPSDCDAFIIMIDYDDVPIDGDFDCDIYVYDEDQNLMGKVDGNIAGLTYMAVPTTGSKHYVRVDFDGHFISKEKQQYNLSTMAISTINVEQTHNIDTAAEIHEWDYFLETIRGDEKDYYKITPVHDNKLRFIVQADTHDDDYSVKLLDKNKNVLDSETGSSPLTVEYDLEEGKQYYIEVAPETTDCFTRSRYLMHVEIDGVGGGPSMSCETFDLTEGETRYNSIPELTTHEYHIIFSQDGNAEFKFQKKNGDFSALMDLYRDGSTSSYPEQVLGTSDNMSITTGVEAGATYRLVIRNFGGSGDYSVSAKIKDSEYAEAIESMPLTIEFPKKVNVPANFDISSKSIHSDYQLSLYEKINYDAGCCTVSPDYHSTFNFANGDFQGISINGKSYTFKEHYKNDKVNDNIDKINNLAETLAKYFRGHGYTSVTISTGDISYDNKNNTIDITVFQIQDSKCIGKNKYVYTRLSICQSIDLNKLKKELEAVAAIAIGVVILGVAPEVIAAAAAVAAGSSTDIELTALAALGVAAELIANAPGLAFA